MKNKPLKVYFLAITVLILGGCGGGLSSTPPDSTSSAEQAALVSDAVVTIVAGAYSQTIEEEAGLGSVSVISSSLVNVIKADGITEATSCTAGSVPSFVDESAVTSLVVAGSSGSCVVMRETNDDENITFKVNCEGYDSGNGVLLDGIFWVVSDAYGSMRITSDGLTYTTDGNECPLILNMTVSGSGNTATASGCISDCGSAFTIANRTQEVAGYCAGSAVSGFESMFSGSCTYPGGDAEPAEGETFSYADIEAYLLEGDRSDEAQLCLFVAICHIDGINDCITMDQVESAGELCGLDEEVSCNANLAGGEGCPLVDEEANCGNSYMMGIRDGEYGARNCSWIEIEEDGIPTGEHSCSWGVDTCNLE